VLFRSPGTPEFDALPNADQKDIARLYPKDVLPGSNYAPLKDGKIHFFLFRGGVALNPAVGPDASDSGLLVLVHGFSTPIASYAGTLKTLSDAYPRLVILAFDHYGRGRSDSARNRVYGMELYMDSISGLLTSIPRVQTHHTAGFHLVGVSMGGSLVSNYAARNPQRIRSLTMAAPAGLIDATGGLKLLTTPIIGRLLVTFAEKWIADKFASPGTDDSKDMESEVASANELMVLQRRVHRGYDRALLSSAATGIMINQDYAFKKLRQLSKPPLVIWGTKDAVVPYKLNEKLRALVPDAILETIPNGGHDIYMTMPEEMVKIMGKVLGEP
jgi:pimeloyl-ACP methyl ester carboxylesterase